MKSVRLTCAMKTDAPWVVGDKDDILTLPDDAAEFVVGQGNAVYLEGNTLQPASVGVQAGTLKTVGVEDPPPAEDVKPGEPLKRPYTNAPKDAWIAYACSVDSSLTPERAEGLTKADLQSKYGERL